MIDSSVFDDLARKLSDCVPESLTTLRSDLQKNFRSVLESGFAKLDLVTRQEFDAQVGVLQRTRAQLDALAARVDALEKRIKQS